MEKIQSYAWGLMINNNIFVVTNFMGVNTLSVFRTKKEALEFKQQMSPREKDKKITIEKVYIRTDSV